MVTRKLQESTDINLFQIANGYYTNGEFTCQLFLSRINYGQEHLNSGQKDSAMK